MARYVSKKIAGIQFGVLSPSMIKKMSVAKIVTPELYDREGYPVDGGLMDIRLGVLDPGLVCKTDGLRLKDGLGHFGFVELARPVMNIFFVRHVYDLLRSCCNSCGRVLLADDKIESVRADILQVGTERGADAQRRAVREYVKKYRAKGVCPHCKTKQGTVIL